MKRFLGLVSLVVWEGGAAEKGMWGREKEKL